MGLNLNYKEPLKGVCVLSVGGEVDLSSSPQLRSAMSPHLKKKKRALIVDLSGVGYMDSSGIATLVEAMKVGQKCKMKFRLAAPSPAVMEVFKMAHLDKIFEVHTSCDEALADLE